MSSLKKRIVSQIQNGGPMPVSTYMAQCLLDPKDGYYSNREPFGSDGDFTTAPEVSQMFGELLGVWAVACWQALGSPSPFVLAEAGPGRGTLMDDLLRATRGHHAFRSAMDLCLIEASSRLAAIQRETLASHDVRIHWAQSVDDLPDRPVILIANELLDALPIRQFVQTSQGWRERCVSVGEDGGLVFVAGPSVPQPELLPAGHDGQPEGSVFEHAPAREAFVDDISARLVSHSGTALFIDYGHLQSGFGDTLQAVRDHAFSDVLDEPGQADITSHVDFAVLADVARSNGAHVHTPQTQGAFLLKLGLLERAGALGAGKDEATQDMLRAAVQRLAGANPDNMGALFKVLCLSGEPSPIFPFDGS